MYKIKLKQFIPLLALVIMLSSCGAKDAQEFNNKLVTIQKSIMTEVNNMKTSTEEPLQKLQHTQDFTKAKIIEVNALKAPASGEAFKQAMVNDFQGIVDSYEILVQMVKQKDDAAQQDILKQKLSDWQVKIADLDASVIEEQKKFADKNHIKLQ